MKIALLGYGRMGKAIERIAIERGHKIVLKIDVDHPQFDIKQADIAIDFSNPSAAYENLKNCVNNCVPVVCGTTGWLSRYDEFTDYCNQKNGAFIYASNFSIGVNLFFNVNEYLAKMMNNIKGYEVELEEVHHIHKIDAPSGTAITLAEQIIENSDRDKWKVDSAKQNELLIKVKREGEVPGTHSIAYRSKVDAIEIKHTAFNRDGFAYGAVIAAEWLLGKQGVFGMKDVLNI